MAQPTGDLGGEILTSQQKLNWCLDNLGQRLAAVGLGMKSGAVLVDLASSSDPIESPLDAQVDIMYSAAKRVADAYGDSTARFFLRSSNPYAGDESLLKFTAMAGNPDPQIAAQGREIVEGAVEAFLG